MKGKLRMSPYRRAREELLSGRDATRIQAMADLEAAIRADQQRIDAEPPAGEDLTREELQGLVDELGTQAYRAEDLLAFIAEMCDAADADGSEVTTARVRSWLGYTGCGGVIVLPEDGSGCGFPAVQPRKASPAVQQRAAERFGFSLRTPATGAGLSGSIADIPPTSRNAADIEEQQ